MSKVAILDLDDTLLDFKTVMMKAIHAETGIDIHWSQWHSYDLLDLYGISFPELQNILITNECIQNAEPFPLASHILNKLTDMGFHICLVSARGWSPNGRELTKSWLEQYDFKYDELIITKVGNNKVDSVDHHKEIELVIDDHMGNCIDFYTSGKVKNTFMMTMPWNSKECLKSHDIERVYCLNDFEKVL